MRSFFVREFIPPDLERRNQILRKIHYVKHNSKNAKGVQNIIKMLRRVLHSTKGQTLYYRCQKGVKLFIGDDTTQKKNFLLSKDARFMAAILNSYRSKKRQVTPDIKKAVLKTTRVVLQYNKIGGVMEKPDQFSAQMKFINRRKVEAAKSPQTKDPYIGIELEYASRLSIAQITDLIIDHKLHNEVRVMHDGSIRINEVYPHRVEFCILTKYTELKKTLEKLRPIIFDKPQNFSPNDSCGFHVHIDMRHDSVNRVFHNLVSMQNVLFDLVADHRKGSKYCYPLHTSDFDEVDEDEEHAHWAAISKFSYFKHNTIEVRMHQSTLSLTRIEKWVTLLKRIADYKGKELKMGTYKTEMTRLTAKVGLEPDLMDFIKENSVSFKKLGVV